MESAELIRRIKQKRELRDIPDSIVYESLEKELKRLRVSSPENLKISDLKIIAKAVRSDLRLLTGSFRASQKERSELLNQGKILELLKTHSSSRERVDFYPALIELINSLKVKSILDLGCGLNPLALASPGVFYYAADIRESELELIDRYFKLKGIKGKTFIFDLRDSSKISELPSADLCLLLKVFDVIEKKGHKLAEEIIVNLKPKCKYLLISFSTKTLSRAPMRHPQRGWIEHLLTRLNFSFKTMNSKNEIFYLAEKKN